MSELREVIVVGGGIGGLAAALGLAQLGKQVTVLEQAPEFGEVGAGLQIAPNGLRALEKLGVLDEVYKHAVFPNRHVFMDALSGNELTSITFGDTFLERYNYPYIVTHRTDLHGVLYRACLELTNISFLSNHRLSSIVEHEEYVELTCENGLAYKAEIVVGADGVNSITRKLFVDDKPVVSGYVAYRFSVPMSEMTLDINWDEKFTWIGPGIHMVQYPVRQKSVINNVAVFKSYRYQEGFEDWGTDEELQAMFANSCPLLQEALKFSEQALVTKLHDRQPIDQWSSRRVTLLGDSAHAMLQYLAQGACQALEDAICLAEKVKQYGSDTVQALESYQVERIPRTAQVQRGARLWGEIKHASDPATILLRNTLFGQRPSDDYTALDWLYKEIVT